MTDWRQVQGSQAEHPEEFDLTTSGVVVYQRQHIERITVDNEDGSTTELWQYDEREMSREEYNNLRASDMETQIAQNRADIDYVALMGGVDL